MGFNIKNVLLNLLYPQLCLQCEANLPQRKVLFCPSCLPLLSLMQVQGRCRTCFGELHKGRCERCMRRSVVVQRQMAACEAVGPAGALSSGAQAGLQDCIAAAASLMAYQWLETKMSLPDVLIPLPVSFWQKQMYGYSHNELIARELGKIFSVPRVSILRRKFDKDHFLRSGEFRCRFTSKKGNAVCDKRVLIISLLFDDRQFRAAGSELKLYFPARVDALAFGLLFDEN